MHTLLEKIERVKKSSEDAATEAIEHQVALVKRDAAAATARAEREKHDVEELLHQIRLAESKAKVEKAEAVAELEKVRAKSQSDTERFKEELDALKRSVEEKEKEIERAAAQGHLVMRRSNHRMQERKKL